jgi:hypothetical protein
MEALRQRSFTRIEADLGTAAARAEICRLRLGLGSIGDDCFDVSKVLQAAFGR